ncbi:poly(U) RNA binding [Halocaridina rubra]|uniref:Poly(U) RNA binding n=1 Tax=Halocaridina rubra TaxID=373956 RepID=A0AAN9AEN0_HALRR
MTSDEEKTVWVGNLHDNVEEDILFELFLQVGPLDYVKIPKDRYTGKKKNFAFVCFKHECSVPYAIAAMDDIELFGRNLKVQSRHLQTLQAQGLASYGPGGIHSLDPFEKSAPTGQSCQQQAAYMPQQGSLLGSAPMNIPAHLLGNIPPHILALAQQQVAELNTNHMNPLSSNPTLNARLRQGDDRFGSAHYSMNNPNTSGNSYQKYTHDQGNWNRKRSTVDNKTMQSLKSRFDEDEMVAQNSRDLAHLQERQGYFDRNRIDAHSKSGESRNHLDRDFSGRSHNRDHRQQPYDSHQDRNHNRHSYDSYRGRRESNNSYHNNRYNRGYRNAYNSRR